MAAVDLVDDWPAPHAAAGVVRADGSTTTTGDTGRPFAWASVTKLLTALAALVAIEEGVVDLDDEAGPPGSTVRHLLAHASGLAPDERRAIAEPGRRRIYSNAGFEVLADTIEARAGMSFGIYVGEAVLQPLAMNRTTLDGSAASGAHGSLADLVELAHELLAPTLIATDTLQQATTVAFPGLAGVLPGFGRQDPNDWGLGFELRDQKTPHWTGRDNSPRTFGHFGRSGAFLWVDPAARVACAVLTDLDFGAWATEAWPVLSDAVLAER